jgi:hypothetical protein
VGDQIVYTKYCSVLWIDNGQPWSYIGLDDLLFARCKVRHRLVDAWCAPVFWDDASGHVSGHEAR